MTYFTDDGIIGGGHFVKDAINSLQSALVLDSDAVILLVVIFQLSAGEPEMQK